MTSMTIANSRPPDVVPEDLFERLLRALHDGEDDPIQVAVQEHLSLAQLAQWANRDQTVEALEGLVRLHDARTQMLISRYRTLAAARLLELSKDEEKPETARRACTDLLKVSLLKMDRREPTEADKTSLEWPQDETALRLLFHELGRESATP